MYTLVCKFRSNERPWTGTHTPGRHVANDDDAIAWAIGMQRGLPDYDLTLFKDGKLIPLPQTKD